MDLVGGMVQIRSSDQLCHTYRSFLGGAALAANTFANLLLRKCNFPGGINKVFFLSSSSGGCSLCFFASVVCLFGPTMAAISCMLALWLHSLGMILCCVSSWPRSASGEQGTSSSWYCAGKQQLLPSVSQCQAPFEELSAMPVTC